MLQQPTILIGQTQILMQQPKILLREPKSVDATVPFVAVTKYFGGRIFNNCLVGVTKPFCGGSDSLSTVGVGDFNARLPFKADLNMIGHLAVNKNNQLKFLPRGNLLIRKLIGLAAATSMK